MDEKPDKEDRLSVSVPSFMQEGGRKQSTYSERNTSGYNGYRRMAGRTAVIPEKQGREGALSSEDRPTQKKMPPPSGNRKPVRKRKKKIWKKVLLAFAMVLSILAGHTVARLQVQVAGILDGMNRENVVDLNDVDIGSDTLVQDDSIINILLVGADKRETWKEAGRSDSVMIATMDMKHKKLKLTSLMRDMYVPIPDHGDDRFNAAYSLGGVELLYKTIANNFGIRADGYAVVDFAAFKEVIDTIGGVSINLSEAEYTYLTTAYKKGSVLKLKPGHNKMNGNQALAYTRIRQDAKGDFGRTERQRKILASIFKEVKGMPFSKITELAKKIAPEITTDLSNNEIVSWLTSVIMMGTTEIDQLRIPLDNTYTQDRIRNMAVLIPDIEANAKAVRQFIYEEDGNVSSGE